MLALLAAAVAVVLIRLGWSGRRGAAAAGWTVAAIALLALTAADGTWGLAMGVTAGTAAALALLLHAAWSSPGKVVRAPKDAPSVTIPCRAGDVARRVAVFALVVPIAFVSAEWLAFAAQAAARHAGAGEADATAMTLLLQPVSWTLIMTAQMTRATTARMATPPAAAALLGAVLWGLS